MFFAIARRASCQADKKRETLTVIERVRDKRLCVYAQVKIWFQNHRYKTKKAAVAGTEACTASKSASSSSSSVSSVRPRCVAVSVLVRDGHPCNRHTSQPASHNDHSSSDVTVTSRSPPTNRVAVTSSVYGSRISAVQEHHHHRW